MSECSHLRIREAGEERDDRVHHVLVIDDAVLTLADQNTDELAEVVAKLLPHGPWHGERIIPTVLWTEKQTEAFLVLLLQGLETPVSRNTMGHLVKLFGHLADDLCVLHVPEHFNPHGAWSHRHEDRCLT